MYSCATAAASDRAEREAGQRSGGLKHGPVMFDRQEPHCAGARPHTGAGAADSGGAGRGGPGGRAADAVRLWRRSQAATDGRAAQGRGYCRCHPRPPGGPHQRWRLPVRALYTVLYLATSKSGLAAGTAAA